MYVTLSLIGIEKVKFLFKKKSNLCFYTSSVCIYFEFLYFLILAIHEK